MSTKLGPIQQKILLLLLSGTLLFLKPTPHSHVRIIKDLGKEWKHINRIALRNSIKNLYKSQLVSGSHNADGTITLTLSKNGRWHALRYKLDEMKIPIISNWDEKWRIVIFDIPEYKKKLRDAFRHHLKRLGFHELQKSVFIHPYPCKDEMDFLIEFYQARPFVRQLIVTEIDNDLHLRKKFRLL